MVGDDGGLGKEVTLFNKVLLIMSSFSSGSGIVVIVFLFFSGQPVDVSASRLWHVDQYGGAQPGHQSADKDP